MSNELDNTIMTLKFSVKEINAILNELGQLPFMQVVGIINAIHSQCAPQINAENSNESKATA